LDRLAATVATATAAFAFFAIAVVKHDQFVHGFNLLSHRSLPMDLGKKRYGQELSTFTTVSVAFSSGANFVMI